MQKNNEIEIHKDSEIWKYEGQVVFTQELVDFFEDERKRVKRENQSDFRHIAFENLENESTYKAIVNKKKSVDEQVELNILLKEVGEALDKLTFVEKKRFILNKIYGYTIKSIAENCEKYIRCIQIMNQKVVMF